MTKIDIEIYDDVISVLTKIKNINDTGIELVIPDGSVLFDNILNLKLLEKETEKLGKVLHLNTTDATGILLLKMLNEEQIEEFATTEISSEQDYTADVKKRRFSLAALHFSRPKFGRPKGFKKIIIVGIALALAGFIAYRLLWEAPKANVKIIVNSQPLTKSIEVKVVKDGETNSENKTLKGSEISTIITKTDSIDTTGEKLVGEKATGKVTFYNYTDEEIEVDEGTELIYTEGDEDLVFIVDEDVTVEAESLQDPEVPGSPTVPGEASAEVTAGDIGDSYNIDDEESLEVDDYKKSELTAVTDGEFEGGKSETVKVVAEEDKVALAAKISEEIGASAESELSSKAGFGKEYIKGSYTSTVTSEIFSAEVDDETDKLELTQELSVVGLAYAQSDLEKMLDGLLDDFIPEGFELYTNERETKVEILGNADSTVLSSGEADLQVTVKTFVIPSIDEEKIKNELAGSSLQEAEKILGSISNVKSYGLEINPNIPFLKKVPRNTENIVIVVEKE